jgi:hypothetical protein
MSCLASAAEALGLIEAALDQVQLSIAPRRE